MVKCLLLPGYLEQVVGEVPATPLLHPRYMEPGVGEVPATPLLHPRYLEPGVGEVPATPLLHPCYLEPGVGEVPVEQKGRSDGGADEDGEVSVLGAGGRVGGAFLRQVELLPHNA